METAAAFVRLNVVDHVHGVADQDDSVNAHDRHPEVERLPLQRHLDFCGEGHRWLLVVRCAGSGGT
jgi:hypothetical protein